jgi:hypothetical protein
MPRLAALISAAFIAGASAPSAVAQPQAPRDPLMPPQQNTIPEKIRPQEPGTTGSAGSSASGETLSEKLERSDGVIRPPENISPDMTVRPPVPNPGTTPVIPPPGSPGGNQSLDPK